MWFGSHSIRIWKPYSEPTGKTMLMSSHVFNLEAHIPRAPADFLCPEICICLRSHLLISCTCYKFHRMKRSYKSQWLVRPQPTLPFLRLPSWLIWRCYTVQSINFSLYLPCPHLLLKFKSTTSSNLQACLQPLSLVLPVSISCELSSRHRSRKLSFL